MLELPKRAFKALKRKRESLYIKKPKHHVSARPMDENSHFNLALAANRLGLFNLANAELKSAEYLGMYNDNTKELDRNNRKCLTPLDELDANQYQRFVILQTHLSGLLAKEDSILDIGGGHGILSRFLPDHRYFLAEPSVNGISGLKLPFADNSFDVVVACHVLEHIPPSDREDFINELVRVSIKNVLLFNPFANVEVNDSERLKLILDVTKSVWAKEHLECGLPDINEITDLLSRMNLPHSVKKYGDISAATALVFMSHFAGKAQKNNLLKINKHLNLTSDLLASGKDPTNIMCVINKPSSKFVS